MGNRNGNGGDSGNHVARQAWGNGPTVHAKKQNHGTRSCITADQMHSMGLVRIGTNYNVNVTVLKSISLKKNK